MGGLPSFLQPSDFLSKVRGRDFPGGPVIESSSCNAEDTGLILGWGARIPHAAGQLGLPALTTEPVRL